MEKYITKNGIKYELRGEQYYPMLKISEQTSYEIGKVLPSLEVYAILCECVGGRCYSEKSDSDLFMEIQ